MKLFGLDVELSNDVPRDAVYMIPSDVKAAIDCVGVAESMRDHGIIAECQLQDVVREVKKVIQSAARERRVGIVKEVKL